MHQSVLQRKRHYFCKVRDVSDVTLAGLKLLEFGAPIAEEISAAAYRWGLKGNECHLKNTERLNSNN